jgi:hypothetical protein
MAIEHYFWSEAFKKEGFPPWPCPACGRHSLSIESKSFAQAEVRESKQARGRSEWDPEWVYDRFVCLICCDRCGEVCSVAGVTQVTQTHFDDYAEDLEPHFIQPAPEIIKIHKSYPKVVAEELRAAFSLFWNDPGSALNSIRSSLEALLDSEKVQRRKKGKRGKLNKLVLHERIKIFLPKDVLTRDKLLAVKNLGNAGSHTGTVRRQQVLEAFELMESILEVVVEKRPQRLERMAREINKRKGRAPKPPF